MAEPPRLVRPMTAVLRHAIPPDDDRYGWELKWDGVRAVGYVEGGHVRLMSRNDKDMSASYPELAALARLLAGPAILDGEIVALDRAGRPDFARLQSRMHVRRPGARLLRAVPVHYFLFDVLSLDGVSLLTLPYTERRDRLDGLGLDREVTRVPPWWRGGGESVLAVSIARGIEGVVGKPLRSRYHPGRRGPWIKVKNLRHQEVVVTGWLPGAGRREGSIGSLVLAVPAGAVSDADAWTADARNLPGAGAGGAQSTKAESTAAEGDAARGESALHYAGNVGTGFTEAALRDLAGRLAPLARDPGPPPAGVPADVARRARWVRPELVGEVAFAERTPEGLLRHPSWRGLRPDKRPCEVRWEDPH